MFSDCGNEFIAEINFVKTALIEISHGNKPTDNLQSLINHCFNALQYCKDANVKRNLQAIYDSIVIDCKTDDKKNLITHLNQLLEFLR